MKKFNAETERKLEDLRCELNKWHENKEFRYTHSLVPALYKVLGQFWCKNNIIEIKRKES